MNIFVQLISLLISFIYGLFIYLLFRLHWNYVIHYSFLLKCFFSFLLGLDISLLYIYLLFSINSGVFHLYFLFAMLLGVIVGVGCHKHVKYVKNVLRYKNK